MVGMAIGARGLTGVTVFAVKPGARIDITGDLLVTVETQGALFAAFEPLMAVAAFFLVFRVRFDDLARHDQRFNLRSCGTGCSKCQSHHESEKVSAMPHWLRPLSVNVHREDVNECRQHHQDEYRQVQDVPQREQAFVQRESRDAPGE